MSSQPEGVGNETVAMGPSLVSAAKESSEVTEASQTNANIIQVTPNEQIIRNMNIGRRASSIGTRDKPTALGSMPSESAEIATAHQNLDPKIRTAAYSAIDALRSVVQHEREVSMLVGPAKDEIIELLTKARFHTKHFAWLCGVAKAHGVGMEEFPVVDITFEATLVQQKIMLEYTVQKQLTKSNTQKITDPQRIEQISVAKQCVLLYDWASEWQEDREAPTYTTSFAQENPGSSRIQGVEKKRKREGETKGSQKAGNKVHRGSSSTGQLSSSFMTSNDQTAPVDLEALIEAGPTAFERQNLPLRAEGKAKFGRKDIFPEHASSLQNAVDDSMPIETVLAQYPNHINAIGVRIMNDPVWTSQHIAEILLELGHRSIFSTLPEGVQREWLIHWVRRRRGCGTQKKRQADNKAAKAAQTAGNDSVAGNEEPSTMEDNEQQILSQDKDDTSRWPDQQHDSSPVTNQEAVSDEDLSDNLDHETEASDSSDNLSYLDDPQMQVVYDEYTEGPLSNDDEELIRDFIEAVNEELSRSES